MRPAPASRRLRCCQHAGEHQPLPASAGFNPNQPAHLLPPSPHLHQLQGLALAALQRVAQVAPGAVKATLPAAIIVVVACLRETGTIGGVGKRMWGSPAAP